MYLFLVEYDNGLCYDDHFNNVIGVYSTQEKAQAVADEYENEDGEGGCIITVIELDKKIVD